MQRRIPAGRAPQWGLLGAVCVAAGSGCGVDCGPPTQVNGAYAMFANVLTYEGTNLEAFPSYQSPANGESEWLIAFDAISGQTTIGIDGQSFDAGGTWDTTQCGVFSLQFGGLYLSAANTSHLFEANGDFVGYGDHVEGTWTYSENWSDGQGESGTFDADGQLAGDRIEGI
jgi:hypothetical protein